MFVYSICVGRLGLKHIEWCTCVDVRTYVRYLCYWCTVYICAVDVCLLLMYAHVYRMCAFEIHMCCMCAVDAHRYICTYVLYVLMYLCCRYQWGTNRMISSSKLMICAGPTSPTPTPSYWQCRQPMPTLLPPNPSSWPSPLIPREIEPWQCVPSWTWWTGGQTHMTSWRGKVSHSPHIAAGIHACVASTDCTKDHTGSLVA